MRISEIYQAGQLGLSIEVFPAKTDDSGKALWRTLQHLAGYAPSFISCTYGAGGTTQERTIDWCAQVQGRLGLPATAHLTCVGSTRGELVDWLTQAANRGVRNIMALRGDPPQGQESFQAVQDGLRYASELVSLIREQFPSMGIGVAGYPETHPEAADAAVDLQHLKLKVEAGADAVFTQLFFLNENFLRFRELYERAGISVPLIPGIMPITEFARIKRITSLCGAVLPDDLASRLEAAQDDSQAQFEIGVEFAIEQCRQLIRHGVPGIHFYVLNRWQACDAIFKALDLASRRATAA